MRTRPLTALLAVAGVLGLLGLLVFGLTAKDGGGPGLGEPAPAEPLPRLDGRGAGSIADYRGRWVLVNLWASWCGPCREESPALQRFYEQEAGPRLTVLGLDTRDLSGDGRAFVSEFDLTYPQLRDAEGEAGESLGATGVPESFLVDPRGNLRARYPGPFATVTDIRAFAAPALEQRG